eukprot:1356246-Amphidinium_carterae.1
MCALRLQADTPDDSQSTGQYRFNESSPGRRRDERSHSCAPDHQNPLMSIPNFQTFQTSSFPNI